MHREAKPILGGLRGMQCLADFDVDGFAVCLEPYYAPSSD
jgi:hypothetical protein